MSQGQRKTAALQSIEKKTVLKVAARASIFDAAWIKALIFMVSLLSVSLCANAKAAKKHFPPVRDDRAILMDLEKLDSLANFLQALADERIPASRTCEIDAAAALALLNPMQARLDEKMAAYIQVRTKTKTDLSADSWLKTCDSQCHCGLYGSILEQVGFEKLNLHDRQNYRTLSTLAMNATKQTLTSCAVSYAASEAGKCPNPTIDSLKKEVQANQ